MSDLDNDEAVRTLVRMMREPSRRQFLRQAGAAGLAFLAADALTVASGAAASAKNVGSSASPVHLTEFTWVGSGQDVQPPQFRAEYEKSHPNVTIDFQPGTNLETYPKIVQSLKVTPNDPLINFGYFNISAITQGEQAGIWDKLDPKVVTNLKNVYASYKRPGNRGVFFSTSMIGLMYNTQLVKTPPTSWNDIFDKKFHGKVALWDDPLGYSNGLIMAARLHGGGEGNMEPGFALFEKAAKAGQFQSLYTSNDAAKQLLVSGTAVITPFFAGLMQPWVLQEKAPLGYVVPKEGQVSFPLGFEIVKGSSKAQVKAAQQIIDLMLAPAAVGEWCKLTYSTPAVNGANIGSALSSQPAYQAANIKKAVQIKWKKIVGNTTSLQDEWNQRVKANLKQ